MARRSKIAGRRLIAGGRLMAGRRLMVGGSKIAGRKLIALYFSLSKVAFILKGSSDSCRSLQRLAGVRIPCKNPTRLSGVSPR
jgi:hypothetical protein